MFTTFKDLMRNYHNVIDENLQRKFEWKKDKVESFCSSLYASAMAFIDNNKLSECTKDMGVLYRFKIPKEDKSYREDMHSYYVDDGGQRVVETCIVAKALIDIINEKKSSDEKYEVNDESYVLLKCILRDIKNNFITEIDNGTFYNIMNDSFIFKTDADNNNIITAYETTKEKFEDIFDFDTYGFNKVCQFFTEYFGFILQDYGETTMETRREKYNNLNNIKQNQTDIHRILSNISAVAERKGCEDFPLKHKRALKDIERVTQFKKGKAENVLKSYYYIKMITLIFENNVNVLSNDSLVNVSEKVKNENIGDFDFYNTFFNDITLISNLRGKNIRWTAMDSKDNNYFALYFTGLMEPFTFSKNGRFDALAYNFPIIKNCFSIKNDCLIDGVLPHVNKNKLSELLTYLLIYRICLNASCGDGNGGDERALLFPLLKTVYDISYDDESMDKHINALRRKVNKAINSTAYKYISTSGWGYNRNGTDLAACIIAGEGKDDSDFVYDIAMKFLNANERDMDHTLSRAPLEKERNKNKEKDTEKTDEESWRDDFWNLRYSKKHINRADNNLDGNSRYIGNDPSFPPELRNRVFTKEDKDAKIEWNIKCIHNFIDILLNKIETKEEPDVAYNVAY